MSTTQLAFYSACTAILVLALGAIALPLVWRRGVRAAAPDATVAQIAVYRDQLRELERDHVGGTITTEQFMAARREIEMRLGEDVTGAPPPAAGATSRPRRRIPPSFAIGAALLVAVPAGAWWLYTRLGAPSAIEVQPAAAPAMATRPADSKAAPLPSMDSLAERLALRLRSEGSEDGESWALLARSYVEIKRYREAADAFAHAAKRMPNDATLLADYADALGMANGRSLKGEPAALAQRALKADPNHPKALALAASAAFEDKNYKQAVAYWRRLSAGLPTGSDEKRGVDANVAEAQALLEGKPPPSVAMPAQPGAQASSQSGGSISGTVRIAPTLASHVSPGDVLLVYAKAMSGPSMPLAIMRTSAAKLPLAFQLDDGQAMLPELRLSSVNEVALMARISHSGGATPQPGDLEGALRPVRVGATDLELVVDQVVR